MGDALQQPIFLPPEIVCSIHNHLQRAQFDSVKTKQIALFAFASISSLYRETALAPGKGDYTIGLRNAKAQEIREFLQILQANPKLAAGVNRLDIRCPNTREKQHPTMWTATSKILSLVPNLKKLELRFGFVPRQFHGGSRGRRYLWNGFCCDLRKLTMLEEFCVEEGFNAFFPEINSLIPAFNKLQRLNLVGLPDSSRYDRCSFTVDLLNRIPSLFPHLHTVIIPSAAQSPRGIFPHILRQFAQVPSVLHLVLVRVGTYYPSWWAPTTAEPGILAELEDFKSMAPRLESFECVDAARRKGDQRTDISQHIVPGIPLLTRCKTLRFDPGTTGYPDDISSLVKLQHLSSFVELQDLPAFYTPFSTLLSTAPGSLESFSLLLNADASGWGGNINAIEALCEQYKIKFLRPDTPSLDYWS